MRSNRSRFLASVPVGLLAGVSTAPAAERPNVVVILAGDPGNADLGDRDGEIRPPNIDRQAATGVRRELFYGMPPCAPARAAPMTGRY